MGVDALRRRERPAPIRLYATAETAKVVRDVLDLIDASGAILLCAESLAWVTPAPFAPVSLGADMTLTVVPVDHLPPGGAAGCVLDVGGRRIVYSCC